MNDAYTILGISLHIKMAHQDTGIVKEQDLTVDNDNNKAYGTISGLRIGTWDVLAELYENDTEVGSGTSQVTIEAGKTAEIHIRINLDTGSANVVVEWGESPSDYLFAFEFSDENLLGVNTSKLEENGIDYKEEDGRIEWEWEVAYPDSDFIHKYNADLISSATGVIVYDTSANKFLIGIEDLGSLKFVFTWAGAADPANQSRVVANWIFLVIGQFVGKGIIEINDKNLWDTYGGWWRGVYLPSFQEVKVYNNTGHDIKVVLAYLYGNELWFKSGNAEAERRWLLPLAKRWSPFDNVDDVGRVRENGDAYIQFKVNITGASEIFLTTDAVNDNGENSKVEIDGSVISFHTDAGCDLEQLTLNNGEHTIKLFGHKTWSHISPRIGMVVIDGDVSVESAEIYPDEYGDSHPMIIDFPQGVSTIEYAEDF